MSCNPCIISGTRVSVSVEEAISELKLLIRVSRFVAIELSQKISKDIKSCQRVLPRGMPLLLCENPCRMPLQPAGEGIKIFFRLT